VLECSETLRLSLHPNDRRAQSPLVAVGRRVVEGDGFEAEFYRLLTPPAARLGNHWLETACVGIGRAVQHTDGAAAAASGHL